MKSVAKIKMIFMLPPVVENLEAGIQGRWKGNNEGERKC